MVISCLQKSIHTESQKRTEQEQKGPFLTCSDTAIDIAVNQTLLIVSIRQCAPEGIT